MKHSTSILLDARAEATLERLHGLASRQATAVILGNLRQLTSVLLGRGVRFDTSKARFYDDKLIAVNRDQGHLLYQLTRASSATSVVEFGTSFGASTIYLAAAVRDNGGGRVVTTELVPKKAAAARANLEEARLAELVEIREGDARETLRALAGPVDMAFIDGFPTIALEVLRVIEPHLREGALVVVDDVDLFRRDLRDIVEYLGHAGSGYRAVRLPLGDGCLVAVKDQHSDSSSRPMDSAGLG